MRSTTKNIAMAALSLCASATANAAIMQFDITETLTVFGVDRVLGATGVTVGAGPELTLADEISNPSSFCGAATVDFSDTANTFSLGAVDGDCFYDSALFQFSNLVVDGVLTGVSAVSGSGNLFNVAVAPVIDLTASGFSVSFDVGSRFTFNSSGQGIAEFTYAVRSVDPDPVPVPATLALLGLGLLGLRARKKA